MRIVSVCTVFLIALTGCGGGGGIPETLDDLLINEINAGGGDDFIELVNAGGQEISLDGFAITDVDRTSPGNPNGAHITSFPAELTLAGGEHFVVVQVSDAALQPGVVSGAACRIVGVTRCMHVTFGLSNTQGDSVFLLNALNDVIAQVDYAPMAAADGQTWCRLPDRDPEGTFAACSPTPGDSNEAAAAQ